MGAAPPCIPAFWTRFNRFGSPISQTAFTLQGLRGPAPAVRVDFTLRGLRAPAPCARVGTAAPTLDPPRFRDPGRLPGRIPLLGFHGIE